MSTHILPCLYSPCCTSFIPFFGNFTKFAKVNMPEINKNDLIAIINTWWKNPKFKIYKLKYIISKIWENKQIINFYQKDCKCSTSFGQMSQKENIWLKLEEHKEADPQKNTVF